MDFVYNFYKTHKRKVLLMQNEISFGFFWKCLKKCWILMIVLAIVAGVVAGAIASFIPKKYSSSVDFYVINTNTSYDYTTTALLSASSYLISDYIEIIKSEAVLNAVAEDLNANRPENEKITVKQLKSMVSASSGETSVFTIKVTHTDPDLALEVARSIEKIAPTKVTDIAKPDRVTNQGIYEGILNIIKEYDEKITMDQLKANLTINGLSSTLNCFTTLNTPVRAVNPDSPNIVRYALFAAVAVAALIYVISVIKSLIELTVTSEDDVKKLVKRPLIGVIPHWGNSWKK